jgi:hypothetical protein
MGHDLFDEINSSVIVRKVVMKKNVNSVVPVILNRAQLARAVEVETAKVFRQIHRVSPDAVDSKGAPMFWASRVPEIRNILTTPEALA